MSPEIVTLPNGLRVVTHVMEQLETTSLGLWVGVGARQEKESEHGLAHLLEHMAFKGTGSRSAQAIAEEIEAVGGELNAATGLEQTSYFARVLKGDEGVALEILADILQNSAFAIDDLEREREVILQEIASTQDSPDDLAYDLLHEAAFPGQSIGRTILGTPDSVRAIMPGDLRSYLARHYRPQNMVLAAAGAVVPETFLRHAEALFGRLSGPKTGGESPARYAGGARWHSKPFEQSHLLIGLEGPSYREERYFAGQVFSGLFGGGMSSRLFQEVREKRGLCYAIYSSAWGLSDTGMFTIHAATGPETMAELIKVVQGELGSMAAKGPTEAEIQRSKAQLKAGLLMSLESSSSRAEQMARQLLLHGRLLTAKELISRVDAVTAADLRAFAGALAEGQPTSIVVGAGKRSKDLAQLASQRLQA